MARKTTATAAAFLAATMALSGALPASSAPEITEGSQPGARDDIAVDGVDGAAVAAGDDAALVHAAEGEATGLYVVELDEPSVAAYRGGIPGLAATSPRVTSATSPSQRVEAKAAYLRHLDERQDEFADQMEATLDRSVDIAFHYLHAVNGMAVRVEPAEAERLAGMPGVAAVYQDAERELATDVSHDLIGSASIWNGETGPDVATRGEGIVVGVIDSGVNPHHPSFAEVDGDGFVHENPLGEGTFLGVCDPDHADHENICNDKLIGAWNFHPTAPNAQDAHGHGSHVGSTIAGNVHEATFTIGQDQITRTIQGVAPHANVISYLVCSPTCPISSILAAVNQAIADEIVDVLNYSIEGSDNPWSDVVSRAFLDAYEAGIFVAASAGNAGPEAGTVANTGPWNTTVAASTHNRVFGHTVDVTGPEPIPPDLQGIPAPPGDGPGVNVDIEAEVRYAGAVDEGNELGCDPFPVGAFQGSIALIERGTCNLTTKINGAAAAEAVAAVIVNNVAGPPIAMGNPEGQVQIIPAVMVGQDSGDQLRAAVIGNQPSPTTVRINAATEIFTDPAWADVMAGFSSRGPSQFDLLAPTFAAPGVNILAAAQDSGGDPNQYLVANGTSMASPHAAGAAALLRALHPDWSPAEVRSALASTADPAALVKEDGATPADPFDRGSGRLDLTQAGSVGLVLDEIPADFEAANPAEGGDPSTLNLPAAVSHACVESCSWTRTLRQTADTEATYTAQVTGPEGMEITVEPAVFNLTPGSEQTVEITVDVGDLPENEWVFAEVRFDTDAQHAAGLPIATVRYPVAVIPMAATPTLTLDPVEITSVQRRDAIADRTVTIGNAGDADLLWEVPEDPPVGGQTTISHSESENIVPGNSVACSTDGGTTTTENGYLRRFDLPDLGIVGDFDVTEVSFGVESVIGVEQALSVNLYTLGAEPFRYENMTPIGSAEVTLSPQTLTLVDVPVTGAAPAGSTLVVEVDAPDVRGVGAFFIGSNAAGQDSPSYLRSASCGFVEPIDTAEIGAAGMHIVMSVTGVAQPPTCNVPTGTPWADVQPLSGSVVPGETQPLTVTLDSSGLTAGVFKANLCLESNDRDRPVAVVPVTMEVVELPTIEVAPGRLDATLVPGGVTEQSLTISNTGDSGLEWEFGQAEPEVLLDNGPLVTHPGEGADGTDLSTLQNVTLGMNILGFDAAADNRIADEFTVTGSDGWDIDTITFYAYQPGSSTESTITAVNYRIWDGIPDAEGSSVVFGDTTTNRLVDTEWTGIYRVQENVGGTTRPIMSVVSSAGLRLEPGTYWVDYQLDGTLESGPFQPPVTSIGETTTGDAQRFADDQWQGLLDTGTGTGQGVPFILSDQACDLPDEVPWLSLSPQVGTTAVGGSSTVTVTFDASGLPAGEHHARLCIASNDPDSPIVEVPVTLTVEEFTLATDAHRSRGDWFVDLTWSATTPEQIDIYRDGELVATVDNESGYTDQPGRSRSGTVLVYQVCEAGTDACSNESALELNPSGRPLAFSRRS